MFDSHVYILFVLGNSTMLTLDNWILAPRHKSITGAVYSKQPISIFQNKSMCNDTAGDCQIFNQLLKPQHYALS